MDKTAAIAILNSLNNPMLHIPEKYNFDHISAASNAAIEKAIEDMHPIILEAAKVLLQEIDKVPASAKPDGFQDIDLSAASFTKPKKPKNKKPEKDAEKPGGADMPDGMQEVIEKVNSLEHVDCERCGRWLWAEVSKPSDILSAAMKKIGFKFAKKKEKWFWKPAGDKGKRFRGRASMPSIRSKYGSEEVA